MVRVKRLAFAAGQRRRDSGWFGSGSKARLMKARWGCSASRPESSSGLSLRPAASRELLDALECGEASKEVSGCRNDNLYNGWIRWRRLGLLKRQAPLAIRRIEYLNDFRK